jgi:hypothetical protein
MVKTYNPRRRTIPPYDDIFGGSDLTPAEKAVRTFEVRCGDRHNPGIDGTNTQTLGGGITDWHTARAYAMEWRKRGIPDADVYVVPSDALRAIFLRG